MKNLAHNFAFTLAEDKSIAEDQKARPLLEVHGARAALHGLLQGRGHISCSHFYRFAKIGWDLDAEVA